jgi:pentapeptide MXKDX repeat protein
VLTGRRSFFAGEIVAWAADTLQNPVMRKKFRAPGNKPDRGSVVEIAASVAFKTGFEGITKPMTISTRIALGVSAAALSLSLALAPAAFAQDKMGKDDAMKKDSMSKDAMKKDDGMKKDGMMKDDGMKKDGMKKDDGMKK